MHKDVRVYIPISVCLEVGRVSRAPSKLYLPPSAARHRVTVPRELTVGGGFGNGRAVCRERHRKACFGGI